MSEIPQTQRSHPESPTIGAAGGGLLLEIVDPQTGQPSVRRVTPVAESNQHRKEQPIPALEVEPPLVATRGVVYFLEGKIPGDQREVHVFSTLTPDGEVELDFKDKRHF